MRQFWAARGGHSDMEMAPGTFQQEKDTSISWCEDGAAELTALAAPGPEGGLGIPSATGAAWARLRGHT